MKASLAVSANDKEGHDGMSVEGARKRTLVPRDTSVPKERVPKGRI